jgi:DNA polymerase I-like protein with 3'-5' exonuclease and polymerase domains
LLIHPIHDEIVLRVKDEHAELAKDLLEKAMADSGDYFVKKLSLRATAEIAQHWKK